MTINFKKLFITGISLITTFTLVGSSFAFAKEDPTPRTTDITPIEVEYDIDSDKFNVKDGTMLIFSDLLECEIKNFKIYCFDQPEESIPENFVSLQLVHKDFFSKKIKLFFTKYLEEWIKRRAENDSSIDLKLNVKAEVVSNRWDQRFCTQVNIANINVIGSEASLVEEIQSYTSGPKLGEVVILK